MSRSHAITAAAAVATRQEAGQLVGGLLDVMDALLATVERETALVRAGNLSEAAALEPAKSELAGRYLAASARLKADAGRLLHDLPEMLALLRERHDLFRALLQINLAVLATAHAVSEGIIRGAAGEVARKAAPQTYGAQGRATSPPRTAMQPVAVIRTS